MQHCHQLHLCASPPRSGQGCEELTPACCEMEGAGAHPAYLRSTTAKHDPPKKLVGSSLQSSPAWPSRGSHISTAHTTGTWKNDSSRSPHQAELLSFALLHPLYLSCRSLSRALTKYLQIHHGRLGRHLPAMRAERRYAWSKLPSAWFTTSGVQTLC